MDVRNVFNTGKNVNHSDDPKEREDDPKQARESSASSCAVDQGDVFSERLDDSSCRDISHKKLANISKRSCNFSERSERKQLEDFLTDLLTFV